MALAGDTIQVRDKVYRLFGIVVPEAKQCGGNAVADRAPWPPDIRCPILGADIAHHLLEEGLVVTRRPTLPAYTLFELQARRSGRGCWRERR